MKTFDEYWSKHATDEFLSKEGVKVLCDNLVKDRLWEAKLTELRLLDDLQTCDVKIFKLKIENKELNKKIEFIT